MANIEIKVSNKTASTNFNEVVSFNNCDRLKFTFDGEWAQFQIGRASCRERVCTDV